MKIAVGFITYNADSAQYLPYFLATLFKALAVFPEEDILVLARDNSDNPDNYNREYIEQVFNKNKKLVDFKWSGENAGFSKSYNIMISEAISWGADSFLMINPDTILSEESLSKMNAALFSDERLASVAPKLLRWDFANRKLTNQIDSCGIKVLTGLRFVDLGQAEEDLGQFDQTEILGPSGAAALYKIKSLIAIKDNFGFLDSRMFMYKEDCDLAYRFFLQGFKSKLVPEALIYHDRTVSAEFSGFWGSFRNRFNKSRLVRAWSFVNQHLLFIKFWANQSFTSKIRVIFYIILMFSHTLIFEPFLLKEYVKISHFFKKSDIANTLD